MLRMIFRLLGLTTHSVRIAIDRLIALIEERNYDELKSFLSTKKGFLSEQYDDDDLSLLHYVAGREFKTADEADEWLSCALAQRNQDIEKTSRRRELRPLHCACLRGNIFGVEWLVSHGANVNVEDRRGCTPYYYACASSVDKMKKMRYLEEHGYILLPHDIVWAARNQFSSSEETDEIFHHLVNVKGLSVNAIDHFGSTPLHRACLFGSILGVKWLVKHNAAVNSVDVNGKTPFMCACLSSIDHSLKVFYLGEKEADCQAIDHEGKTALFHATDDHSKCEDDVKDVLRYLVIEKGIDINSIDKNGATPLLYACDLHPSFAIIQQLIELGADASARDRRKQNALHMAAQKHRMTRSSIDLLIEKGVDVTCQDENGHTPYEVARDGEIRALLRQRYDAARFSVLQREMVRPDSIKVCVTGDEMAGKTTLVNSLLQLNQPPPKDEDRTPGVDIHNCVNEEIGKGSWWDFGAQPTFHSAHGLFFQRSNTLFCLVLPIRKGENMTSKAILRRLLKEGEFWCAFAKAALRTLPSQSKSLIRLVIIFNLIGVDENKGIEMRFLEEVAQRIEKEFKDTFEISLVIKMDCSKSRSDCMKDFREKLKKIREDILKAADDVPKLCHAIEKHLSLPDYKRKKPLAYFLTADEFEKWVAEEVGIKLAEDEKKVAVEYLDASGIIINLGRRICVRPLWLCHNVIGPLLAPPNFIFGMPRENSGKASKEDIESVLRIFKKYLKQKGYPSPFVVTADEALEVLLYLELCIPVEREVYLIPALLDDLIPADAWIEDSTIDVYRGQRYECNTSVDIISPSSFAILQSRCSHLASVRQKAWKNGIKLVKIACDKVIECLITMGVKKGHHCIEIIFRWSSKAECEAVAKEFLDELKLMIAAVCDERSPGVVLNWFYLDSFHLQLLNDDPAIYSSREVDQKVKDNALDDIIFSARPERHHRSFVRDLVIIFDFASDSFLADDALISDGLIVACAFVGASLWEHLGASVLSRGDLHYIREHFDHNHARMVEVLKLWNTAKSPTVGQLLRWFEAFEVNRRAIKSTYESLYGSHGK